MSLPLALALLCASTMHGVICTSSSQTTGVTIDSNRLLKRAIMRGQVQMIVELLEVGADPNARDSYGNTSLHFAAMMDCDTCVDAIMKYPGAVDLEARNGHGMTPLFMAAWYDKPRAVTALAAYGADVNAYNGTRGTLTTAAWRGSAAMVKALLDAGANPNFVEGAKGRPPLFLAAEHGYLDCALLLLKYGAYALRGVPLGPPGSPKNAAQIAEQYGYKDIAHEIKKWHTVWKYPIYP